MEALTLESPEGTDQLPFLLLSAGAHPAFRLEFAPTRCRGYFADMSSLPDASDDRSLAVLIPVYNDWEALVQVVDSLDRSLATTDWQLKIVIVDDGSDQADPPREFYSSRHSILSIDVLRLRRNLGHQRAIAVGLAWLEANKPCTAVVVMDGDGEDSPSDVPRLIARFEED